MSVADHGSSAPSLRRLPFTIRLSPQLVNALIADQMQQVQPGAISGLLFGMVEEGVVLAQAHSRFPTTEGAGGSFERSGQNRLFEQQRTAAQKSAGTASLGLVGWYAIRQNGGLTGGDFAYHDWFFPRPNDIALVLRPEMPEGVSLELYCRVVSGQLTEDEHRAGLVRLSNSTVESPVEIVPRPKIQDHFFMRAYELGDASEEKPPGWKGTLAVRYRKAFSFWKTPAVEEANELALEAARPLSDLVGNGEKPSAPPIQALSNPASHPQDPAGLPARQVPASGAVPTASENSSPMKEPVRSAAEPAKTAVPQPSQSVVPPPAPALPPPAAPTIPSPAPATLALSNTQPNAPTAPAYGLAPFAGTPPSAPQISLPPVTSPAYVQPERPKSIWPRVLVVFLLTTAITFGVVYLVEFSDGLPKLLQLFSPQTSLGLKVEPQGDRLLVTWNRQHPSVQHAREGFLLIEDGSQRRQVILDATHVAHGSILYHPHSGDITFRLEIHGVNGQQVSDTMRVLDADKPDSGRNAPLELLPLLPWSTAPAKKQTLPGPPRVNSLPVPEGTATDEPVKPVARSERADLDRIGGAKEQTPASNPKAASDEQALATPEEAPAVHTDQSNPLTGPPVPRVPPESKPASPIPASAPPVDQPANQPSRPSADASPASTSGPVISYQPPRPIRQVLPNVGILPPGLLSQTNQLEVLVKVDETGRVTSAQPAPSAKHVSQVLLGSALMAARQWRFEPATLRGKAIASEHSIVFQFSARKQ